ncbi:hypothetical protein MTO96_011275 [Rhipicephalus appendiculatus]
MSDMENREGRFNPELLIELRRTRFSTKACRHWTATTGRAQCERLGDQTTTIDGAGLTLAAAAADQLLPLTCLAAGCLSMASDSSQQHPCRVGLSRVQPCGTDGTRHHHRHRRPFHGRHRRVTGHVAYRALSQINSGGRSSFSSCIS